MKTILFIDDNEALQSVYKDAFERLDYHIISAYSGQSGLAQLEDIIPDLVILDIMMEPMDGWMVLLEMRKEKDLTLLPVIVMTAKSLHPHEIISYGELINGYITKPLRLTDIRKLLDTFWEEWQSIQATAAGAREQGVSEEIIREYMILRNQTRVIQQMLTFIEQMFDVPGMDDTCGQMLEPELGTIRELLTKKNEDYQVIQQKMR
ncbi:MAG: response regulator [Methanospirillaceae archaeon]|nr:response regulator [Methanospirillaceae archaeon]